ncbi:MAG: 30S ribosomal protein S14 [Alphaproteobacteria bacterium]|nr:30S ribosomal protein S14 [Alphaproteobacteria bacterium]
MAKTSAIERNKKRVRLVAKVKARHAKLKAVVMDRDKPIEERFDAMLKLQKLPRNGSKVRIHNRCELSGRSRAYYRKLKLSRIALRDLASAGQIPGMVKASW